ncbi:MAG: CopG family transcriptional regulator [Opitutaceae bacterium]|jgi:predicted DNA-binding protein|nr:CopG family transcriptional regulator [Opitutaceae bacterium]
MATKKNIAIAPLTFDLPLSLIEKITARQKKFGIRSASEVVREAVAHFDIERCASTGEPHRQISVRLPAGMKSRLVKAAKRKKISIGGLLRIAIDAYEAKSPPGKKSRSSGPNSFLR